MSITSGMRRRNASASGSRYSAKLVSRWRQAQGAGRPVLGLIGIKARSSRYLHFFGFERCGGNVECPGIRRRYSLSAGTEEAGMLAPRCSMICFVLGFSILWPQASWADQAFQRFLPLIVELDGWQGKKADGASMEMSNMSMTT